MTEQCICSIVLAILFIICVILTVCAARDNNSSDFGVGIAISCTIAAVFIAVLVNKDKWVMQEADRFFKSRPEVYKCENLSEMVCSTKKEVWRQDSLVWVKRLDKIKGK